MEHMDPFFEEAVLHLQQEVCGSDKITITVKEPEVVREIIA